jgi:hypothetical protein
LFSIIFTGLGLLAIIFLKEHVYPQSTFDHFEATISLNEVDNLSNTEIVEKLFTMYLEHYKDKPIFDEQRIKDYKDIQVEEEKYVTDGTAFSVSYLVKQHLWNVYWEIGGKEKGGMVEQFVFVTLNIEKEQFRMEVNGTSPPIPK